MAVLHGPRHFSRCCRYISFSMPGGSVADPKLEALAKEWLKAQGGVQSWVDHYTPLLAALLERVAGEARQEGYAQGGAECAALTKPTLDLWDAEIAKAREEGRKEALTLTHAESGVRIDL